MEFSTVWLYKDRCMLRLPGSDNRRLVECNGKLPPDLYDNLVAVSDGRIAFRYLIDDKPCRVETVNSGSGKSFVIRQLNSEVKSLKALGTPDVVVDKLMRPEMGGLMIIAGLQGSGKTTLASSILIERIKKIGGVAQIVEDPPELNLEGIYDGGVVQQIDIHNSDTGHIEADKRLAYLVSRSLRADTDIVFLGEVLTPAEAKEVISYAGNGTLVITTIHGTSLEMAIERLTNLAAMGNMITPEKMLANSLNSILYVSPKTIFNTRAIGVDSIFLEPNRDENIRAIIREKEFFKLKGTVAEQAAKMGHDVGRGIGR